MKTMTIEQWEKEKGCLVLSDIDLKKVVSEKEFNAIPLDERHSVDHDSRTKFLRDNGFEVTRENMMDHRLSAGHKIIHQGEILDYDEYRAMNKTQHKLDSSSVRGQVIEMTSPEAERLIRVEEKQKAMTDHIAEIAKTLENNTKTTMAIKKTLDELTGAKKFLMTVTGIVIGVATAVAAYAGFHHKS